MQNRLISFVIPVYNESAGLEVFHSSLMKVVTKSNYNYEIVYVDDGSADNSPIVIKNLQKKDSKHIKPIFLSRNFGKEMATTAGINHSTGDAIMLMDADGQHPVNLIPQFIDKWEGGVDVVIGVRIANKKEGVIKKVGSKLFYRLLRYLGVKNAIPGATDFRIIDRNVADEFNKLTEHNRLTRALIDWLGYNKEIILFSANAREHGQATYSIKKLFQLALNGFISLSFTPLYFAGYLGAVITLLSLLCTLFLMVESYLLNDPLGLNISGTAFLALLVIFLVGIVLCCQGLLSIYVAHIYSETQNRPLYITKKLRK